MPVNRTTDLSTPAATLRSWVDLYSESLLSWAVHKTGQRQIAEDLVQDTFLAALKGFERFRGDSEPKTWLFSILNNKIIDYYRKELKNPLVSDEDFLLQFFDEGGQWKKEARPQAWMTEGQLLDNPEFQQALKGCLAKLPAAWRMAIQLKYYEEKKGSEICQELDITAANFWQLIHRSKLQLRKCLEKNWFNF